MEGIESQEMRMSGLIKTEIKTEIEGEFYTRMVSENNEDLISEKNSKSLSQSDHDIFLPLRCRLCAIPKNDMVDIFSCNESKEDISVMIKHCLPIVVQETDTLPKQACRFCLEILEVCCQFRKTVSEAEKLLLATDGQSAVKLEEIDERPSNTFSFVGVDKNDSETIASAEPRIHTNINRSLIPHSFMPCLVPIGSSKGCVNNIEIIASEEQITDTNVDRGLLSQRLMPPLVPIVSPKTCIKNLDKAGGITTPVSQIDLQTTSASRTPRTTSSRSRAKKQKILTINRSKELEIRGNRTVPEGAHTSKTQAGIETDTVQDKLDELCTRERIDSSEYCGKKFTSRGKKNRHCTDAEGSFECYICKKNFETSPELKRHKAIHMKNGDYRCSTCDVSFKDEFRLKRHDTLVHTQEKPWQCDYCKEYYNLKANLKRHVSYCKQRSDVKEQTYKCNLCGKAFKTREGVSKHNKFHTGEGLHSCQYCGKKFISIANRDAHHRKHTNERPFKCPICEKTFSWRSSLRNHAAVHWGKK